MPIPAPRLDTFRDPNLDRRMLWGSEDLLVSDARWDRRLHDPHRQNMGGPSAAFVLMRRGAYVKRVGKQMAVGGPAHLTLYNARETADVDHPWGDSTRGTTFLVPVDTVGRMLEDLGQRQDPGRPFSVLSVPVEPATYLLYQAIAASMDEPVIRDRLCVAEMSLQLVRCALTQAVTGRSIRAPLRQFPGESRVRDRIPLLQGYLMANSAARPTLDDLAAHAGCTPWHLSRLFREETGLPISKFVARVRVRRTLERVMAGEQDLSAVAHEEGFSSHGHFSHAFRREFGVSPSQVRQGPAAERIRILASRAPTSH